MPGKKITDHQVHKYKQHRNTLAQVAAAARACISERIARPSIELTIFDLVSGGPNASGDSSQVSTCTTTVTFP